MERKEKRKFFTLAVTQEEFEKVNKLIVEITKAKDMPVDRTDIMRDGLDRVSVEYTGETIFFNENEVTA